MQPVGRRWPIIMLNSASPRLEQLPNGNGHNDNLIWVQEQVDLGKAEVNLPECIRTRLVAPAAKDHYIAQLKAYAG